VPIRAPLPRVLMWAVVVLCGIVAVVGGLALRGQEVIAIGIAGALAGCMAAGIVRESPAGSRTWSALEAAASVGAMTVGVLLVVAGIAALAGGLVAALTAGGVLLVVLVARLARGRGPAVRSTADRTGATRHPSAQEPARHGAPAGLSSLLPPVAVLTTAELSEEWTRTSAILAGRLDAAARASLVARREEALDELERRDPPGFARWLAAGPTHSSDPAGYVQGGPLRGDPAADTDAA
jgi:hypothetical protein